MSDLKKVSKEEFYSSKWLTNEKFDCSVSVDDSKYPYTTLLKRKFNNGVVGKITPDGNYFIK